MSVRFHFYLLLFTLIILAFGCKKEDYDPQGKEYWYQVYGKEGSFISNGCADTCITVNGSITLDLDSNYFNDLKIDLTERYGQCLWNLDSTVTVFQSVQFNPLLKNNLYFLSVSTDNLFTLQKGEVLGSSITNINSSWENNITPFFYRRDACYINDLIGSQGSKYVGIRIKRLDGYIYGWINLELKIITNNYDLMQFQVKESFMSLIPGKAVIVGEPKFAE